MTKWLNIKGMYAQYYPDHDHLEKWAYDNLGLTILFSEPVNPKTTYYGNNVLYAPHPEILFHEIGRYVVAPNERRRITNCGVHRYTREQLRYIQEQGLINKHIEEEHRAITYAYYLHGWFNYARYKWNMIEGDVENVFEKARSNKTYSVKHNLAWLVRMKLLDGYVPTGKLFTGDWTLDADPLKIVEGMDV